MLQLPLIEPGQVSACPRCHTTIYSPLANSVDKTLALSLTGLILFVPAIFMPLLTLKTFGLSEHGSIFDGVISLINHDYYFVAIMVLLTSVLLPLLKLGLLFSVSLAAKYSHRSLWCVRAFRLLHHLDEWAMLDIYLIALLVTIIKVYDMAEIRYELGSWCFVAVVSLTIFSSSVLDKHLFWQLLDTRTSPDDQLKINDINQSTTARQAGLLSCHDCQLLVKKHASHSQKCPRCQASLHSRQPDSISRTWALLITATLFFLPANILPIMEVNFLGRPDASTIMDGIIYFFHSGSYGIGAIIFMASILVPLFKIIALVIVLLTVKMRKKRWLRHKAVMFRLVEFIGRWSMLDVFVVALLAVLVNFGTLTSIQAQSAATYFTAVVVMTMLAALTFDPRLLWDDPPNMNA